MNILIVESAAKAKTLRGYLGDDWRILATGGHVQTLPHDRAQHGKDAGKAFWANRVGELPSPPWVWTERGEEAVRKIVEEAGPDPVFWIATDPDREGEFIAWCLDRILKDRGPTHRVTFDEVTREAVLAALEHPRPVDRGMVESALVRKFLDRLVGYRTSKLASTLVPPPAASMGRVQTPTLGFVVERELEREAHEPIPYFEVRADAHAIDLRVRFHEPDDPAAWRDDGGRHVPTRTSDGDLARGALAALEAAGEVTITEAKQGTRQRRPDPPLSTDALLQAAGSAFGWSPGKTSALASMLYEAGHITYIRTDSTRLAESAVRAARQVVASSFGDDHLGPEARANVSTGPTQDAHEAIRPTRPEVAEPDLDDDDARTLYRLIRARTLASQMAPSVRATVSLRAASDGLDRPLTGSVAWRTFAGWEAAYAEFLGNVATEPPAAPLEPGALWPLDPGTAERDNPLLVEDETRPPARYRPHTLIKAMKDAGIGRPSTYASTVEKLQDREYVELEDGSLVPTERGRVIWTRAAPLYADEDGTGSDDGKVEAQRAGRGDPAGDGSGDEGAVELFSTDYTALMEDRLDRIAGGEVPAPESWEGWRDRVRALHEVAKERLKAGAMVPSQRHLLQRLLENAPDHVRASHPDLGDLSHEAAGAFIRELLGAGVKPSPTARQWSYLRQLAEDLELSPGELEAATGHRDLDEIRTMDQASGAIDELRQLHDERRPPSPKQRRFIEGLLEDVGLEPAEAARLVGAKSLDELTGGAGGTASALIDALQERAGRGAPRGAGGT